ncbi:MAG: hypothetical protein KC910_28505 [Candidatus Eremiobacteraeota bacterium]|nr:hypothetical protein [Candidatus Eremiobacteraeota bacterium]
MHIQPNMGGAPHVSRANTPFMPPAAPPTPPPAQQGPSDGVSLNATPSGVKFQVTPAVKDGQQVFGLTVAIPASPLVAGGAVIEIVRNSQGQVVESKAQVGAEERQVHAGEMGNVFVSTGDGQPWLYLNDNAQDPQNFLTYGMSDAPTQTPDGATVRERQEYVKADGTRNVVHHEVSRPGVRTFTSVEFKPDGSAYAAKVEDKGGKPADEIGINDIGGTLKRGMNLFGGGGWKETAMRATVIDGGAIRLTSDATPADSKKAALRSGQAPDMALISGFGTSLWGRFQGSTNEVIVPISAQAPAAARPPQMPFMPPTQT